MEPELVCESVRLAPLVVPDETASISGMVPGSGVDVAVGVLVGVGKLGVFVGVGGMGVIVGVGVSVEVADGVGVSLGDGGTGVFVGVSVSVGDGGTSVSVGVGVSV